MAGSPPRQGRCPFDPGDIAASRRALLLGAGTASAAALLGSGPASAQPSVADDSLAADHAHDRRAHDFDNDGTREAQPFYGEHQSGIVNPQPAAKYAAAAEVLGLREEVGAHG